MARSGMRRASSRNHVAGVGVRCYTRLSALSPAYRQLRMIATLPMQEELDPFGRDGHDDLHEHRTQNVLAHCGRHVLMVPGLLQVGAEGEIRGPLAGCRLLKLELRARRLQLTFPLPLDLEALLPCPREIADDVPVAGIDRLEPRPRMPPSLPGNAVVTPESRAFSGR